MAQATRRAALCLIGLGLLAVSGCVSEDEGDNSLILTGKITNVASGRFRPAPSRSGSRSRV